MQFSTVAIILASASSAFGAIVGVCPPWKEDAHYLLADSEDCTIFYKCNPWGPVKIECPKGLYFATQHNWCDFKENAICAKKN